MRKNIKNKKGFLLIEILVAVFIFTIVMLISLTAVISLLDANKKNQAIKSVVNNLNLVINSMVKNIAVGDKYFCGNAGSGYPGDYSGGEASDCPSGEGYEGGADAFTFRFNKDTNSNGSLDVYRFKYEETDTVNNTGRIMRSVDGTADKGYIPITAPEVKITYFRVYVYDTKPLVVNGTQDDVNQPRVTIIVRGYAGAKSTLQSQFNIQTTISQRTLDAYYQ